MRIALDAAPPSQITWFFRDDDAGWADERLWPLVAVFASSGVMLDVAAIPAALHPKQRRRLGRLVNDQCIAVHQHGWSHANHEMLGRACEFGSSRSARQQADDLVAGMAAVEDLVGLPRVPVFVPPWNRCSETTVQLLRDLGFAGLSRDASAPAAQIAEVRVSADWTRLMDTGGLPAVGLALAERIAVSADAAKPGAGDPVGVMLHHARLEAGDLKAIAALLALIRNHPAATCASLTSLVSTAVATTRRTQ